MKKIIQSALVLAAAFYAANLWAVIYIWPDEKGAIEIADQTNRLPKEFMALLGENPPDKKQQGNAGYWRDERGNFHFFRLTASEPATPKKIEQVRKNSYDPEKDELLRGKPNPEVLTATVDKILAPDMILLTNGDKVRYTGIAWPAELSRESASFKAAMEYERSLIEGKTVKILFDRKKRDKDGNFLGQVFYGTNVYVNADLVFKGFAQQKIEPPNYEYLKLYRKLEDHARKNQLGIWKELQAK